jgi:hypothetical protein
MKPGATIYLLVYAFAIILSGTHLSIGVTIGIAIGGFMLLLIYSLCCAAKKGDRDMERMAREMWESNGR